MGCVFKNTIVIFSFGFIGRCKECILLSLSSVISLESNLSCLARGRRRVSFIRAECGQLVARNTALT